ncbi:hypothetical protein BOX15_Mlig001659g2 [Macrostomum lignano]|uniref:DUF4515 domain-containing protein n=1 Tax=Macrostomum lignano TaxID=282301 RepID=A0A267FI61_9PLAT|nr:hypothetical protein BOX15_Mlig001659g2 [Macrostomum lignano]
MPPKKGKKKGKSKGKDKSAKKADESVAPEVEQPQEEVVDKEQQLKEELAKVIKEVEDAKKKLSELKSENEWLQEESQRIRVESHEYMGYMEKRADKRQKALITLSDYNEHEIKVLLQQREEMLEAYSYQKEELKQTLLSKQNELSKARDELDELAEFKKLKDEQAEMIKHLEKEAQNLRIQHSEQLQQLKAKFMREKREFQEESEQKVHQLSKEAYKEAITSLIDHSNTVKLQNRKLRKDLLHMIQQTRLLQEHKRKLEIQHDELLKEQEFSKDIRKLRNATKQLYTGEKTRRQRLSTRPGARLSDKRQ